MSQLPTQNEAREAAARPVWRGGYADCRFGQLHFRAHLPPACPGLPLVMLNPRSRSCRHMLPAVPGHAVLLVDIPGLGGSTPIPSDTTMPQVGAAIGEFLDDQGLDRVHLFGIHTGNKVAAALAADAAGRVASLTLCGKTHSLIVDPVARNAAMRAQVDAVKPDVALVRMEGRYVDEDQDTIEAFPRLYQANFEFDLRAALGRTSMPVQIIEIVSDEETRAYGRQGELLAASAPDGRCVQLEQIEAAGLDMYVGAARMGRAIKVFVDAAIG